jgi:hypothetical protein
VRDHIRIILRKARDVCRLGNGAWLDVVAAKPVAATAEGATASGYLSTQFD